LEDVDINRILRFQKDLIKYVDTHAVRIKEEIRGKGDISDELAKEIDAVIKEVKELYNYS
jgi:F-type H+-transporting ATPase subunit alpha